MASAVSGQVGPNDANVGPNVGYPNGQGNNTHKLNTLYVVPKYLYF